MKQSFPKEVQKKFLDYFKAKDKPSQVEKDFFEKAYKYVKLIKWVPGLEMVAVGNSLSMNAGTKESDIDLFIVTKDNAMWFVRIIVTFIFQILGVRKTAKKHAGRFCLSFFCTKTGMDFSSWKLENDIYLYFRIIYLKPILNYNNTYEEFLKVNSKWADFGEYKDTIKENEKFIKQKAESRKQKAKNPPSPLYQGENSLSPSPFGRGSGGGFCKAESKIVSKLNSFFKSIFLSKTLKHHEKLGKPFGIIINDNMLKFHNNDIRKKVIDEILI